MVLDRRVSTEPILCSHANPCLHAGANGNLLNNPYYLSGMIVLLTAFFSLPAPVAEFRYTLCMIAC